MIGYRYIRMRMTKIMFDSLGRRGKFSKDIHFAQ